jgi:flagellar motor protein MotB
MLLLAAPLAAQDQGEVFFRNNAPKKALQRWQEALDLFMAGQREPALVRTREALELAPGFVDAHLLQGEIYAAGTETEPQEPQEPAKAEDPQQPKGRPGPGAVLRFDQDSLAVDAYRRGLDLAPDYQPAGWLRLAKVLIRQERYAEAIEPLEAYAERCREDQRAPTLAERDRMQRLVRAMANPVPFDPRNLGDSVNSPHAEYLPSLSLDDSLLIITRRLGGTNEDFYVSRRRPDGSWGQALNLGPPVNTPLNEGAQHLSADGRTLLFTMCNQPDGLGSCDLYESTYVPGKGWSAARNLGEPVNSPHWDSQPCLSADGLSLYFSSNRPGGQGERDLWMSRRSALLPGAGAAGGAGVAGASPRFGPWSAPVNLGPVINTKGLDQAPFLHPDGSTLYFTSEGHGSLGGTDLFLSRLGPDGQWQQPENLGYPINTADNEGSLSVSANGRSAWYASDRTDSRGLLDIYAFELPESLRAAPVTYLRARVRDAETGQPLMAAIELTRLADGQLLSRSVSEAGSGHFFAVLPSGQDYALAVLRKGYLFHSEHFSLPGGRTAEPFLLDIALQPVKAGGELVLRNVFFASGSASLDERSEAELRQLLRLLADNPGLRIRIGGHTDDVGSDTDNQRLSEARARTVRDYLVTAGVAPERLEYRGYGESRPVEAGVSEAARALNRRTTVEVLE